MNGLSQTHKQASKFLEYILGRCPFEFGLVPDAEGFVKLKDFLMATSEEDVWHHIRPALLNQIINGMPDPPIEIDDNRIRATNREHLPGIQHAVDIPKLLYTTVTRKSHPVVLEDGVFPTRHPYVILSSDKNMALRLGKRRDSTPVLLTVNVPQTEQQDIFFKYAGGTLYLADQIPPDCFTAPPLPKEKMEPKKHKKHPEPERSPMPGSYMVDFSPKKDKAKKSRKENDGSWKRNKKRMRRESNKEWPE